MKNNSQILGAIDIGSNAIRLLIKYVDAFPHETEFKKVVYIRVPIRLGEDVFTFGKIGEEKQALLSEAMQGFAHLLKAYRVNKYRTCATSAMRESSNGAEIIRNLKTSSGIDVGVISGTQEAMLVYKAGKFEKLIDPDQNYIYMDVGGGSTEIIVYTNHQAVSSQSFKLGTVRIISQGIDTVEMQNFREHLLEVGSRYRPVAIIGSGGNINKVEKLLRKKSSEPVTVSELKTLYNKLDSLSFEQRMEKYQLNSYRADVILPAVNLFYTAAVSSRVENIIVPKVGLVDGIIRQLYEDEK